MKTDASREKRSANPSGASYSSFHLVLGGLFGAAALVLPLFFHAVGLGRMFLPMYPPLLVVSLLVSTPVAVATVALVPIVSSFLTGMPPVYPPMLPKMCAELITMALVASLAYRRARWGLLPSVVLAIVAERAAYVIFTMILVGWFHMPGREISLALLIVGWPGIVLQVAVALAVVPWLEPRVRRMEAID